jgi:hypothetical protein
MTTTEATPEATTVETFIERVDIDDDEATAQTRALGEFLTEPRKGLFAVDVARLDSTNAPPGVDAHEAQYKNALLYTVQRYSEAAFIEELGAAIAWPDEVLRAMYRDYVDAEPAFAFPSSDDIIGEYNFFPDIGSLREFCADVVGFDDDFDGRYRRDECFLKQLIEDPAFDPTDEISREYRDGSWITAIAGGFLLQCSDYDPERWPSLEDTATRLANRLR